MSHLVVTVPGEVETDGEVMRMSAKTLSGLEHFAHNWGDKMTFVAQPTAMGKLEVLGMRTVDLTALPYAVELVNDRLQAVEGLQPQVVLTTLAMSELPLMEGLEAPFVITTECDLQTRLEWARAESKARVNLRHSFGLRRLEHRYRRIIRRAAGIQANGWPTWATYGPLSRSSLLYYDSRVSREMAKLSECKTPLPDRPFSIAFSGRWIRPKGFPQAFEAFARARELTTTPMRLLLFGGGPLENEIPNDEEIINIGSIDYESEWVPFVAREVDVLLAPHPQSDPACTYIEAAALGAPFVSFANRAARHLEKEHDLGWTAPMGSVEELAKLIAWLADDGQEHLERARTSARTFMTKHPMEAEFARRTRHLASCASEGFR